MGSRLFFATAVIAAAISAAAFGQRAEIPEIGQEKLPHIEEPHKDPPEGKSEERDKTVKGMQADVTTAINIGRRYFEDAEGPILDELAKSGPDPQDDQIASAIKSGLIKKITAEAASDPKLGFELRSGNLKMSEITTWNGIKISGGELNMYEMAGALAAIVKACREHRGTVRACLHDGLKGIGNTILAAFKPAT